MTAGFFGGNVNQPGGYAGVPLAVLEYDDTNIDLPPAPAPVGTPVPLVTLTSSTGPLAPAGYTGTVNWGDGTPVDAASFTPFPARSLNFLFAGLVPGQTLFVDGPDHTYQTPGTFDVTIAVTAPGAATATISHDSITIAAPMITLSGQLNPASDSGISDTDGVTNINTPSFFGTTQPGATVVLTISSATDLGAAPVVVGAGVADPAGNWSIQSSPLYDGFYFVTATATGKFGASVTTGVGPLLTGPGGNLGELIIDTIGPKIAGFQVTNARTGTFQVGFTDPYGLVLAPLTDPSNYVANRPSPTPRKGQKFPVATLTASTVSYGPGPMPTTSTYPVLVTGTLGGRKPLVTRNGTYTFVIHSAAIISIAGTPLDGEFAGRFPSGDGHPGGDFRVRINVRNGKIGRAVVLAPAATTTHPVRAQALSRHRA